MMMYDNLTQHYLECCHPWPRQAALARLVGSPQYPQIQGTVMFTICLQVMNQ